MSKTNPTAPAAEPDSETGIEPAPARDVPRGVETALGGVTREQVQADSPIYAEIAASIEFHRNGECKHGIASAQLVRDVLGSIARMAMPDGVVRRPANRPAELREWPAASIRQLAALCRVYAPGDIAPAADEPAVKQLGHEGQREAATPEPTVPVSVSPAPPVPGQAEQVAEIERQVRAERANGSGTVTTITGPPIPPVFHAPEPYRPELDAPLVPGDVAPAYVFHAPEPYRADAPASPMSPAGDDIPF